MNQTERIAMLEEQLRRAQPPKRSGTVLLQKYHEMTARQLIYHVRTSTSLAFDPLILNLVRHLDAALDSEAPVEQPFDVGPGPTTYQYEMGLEGDLPWR
jgi:hypothetical protein